MLTTSTNLDLSFKGVRDYLHGTDIFDKLVELSGAEKDIKLRINKIIRNGLVALPGIARGDQNTPLSAMFSFEDDGGQKFIGLREDPAIKILDRYPYDEDVISTAAHLGDQTITLDIDSEHSFIELIVILNKTLLTKVLAQNTRKWMFTRVEIDNLPRQLDKITMKYSDSIGARLVKSSIAVNGDHIGHIYFSGV
jgi:hypothetical protein